MGDTLDTVFGIGFRIGFLVVLVGVFMSFFTVLKANVELVLDYSTIWHEFNAMPQQIKLIVMGTILMGIAIVMGVLRENIEDFINLLFYNDKV